MAQTHTAPVKAGEKQDVVVAGKPLNTANGTISVTYNPGPGDPRHSEIFGKKVKAGEAVDIPARYADKVAGNPYLSTDGKKEYVPPAGQEPEEQEEATFEENVARERSKEYLQGRTHFANSPPGEADRVSRAIQAAAELQDAQDDPDADDDKPRRGRQKAR